MPSSYRLLSSPRLLSFPGQKLPGAQYPHSRAPHHPHSCRSGRSHVPYGPEDAVEEWKKTGAAAKARAGVAEGADPECTT
ncbi:hypothetical protein A6R68_13451 [Neotoma lepida]|uniref:Uncharacterized protein n=1 Tax=Neotoma lepida TaxID=56216 RepID=A0A1A6H138_NEOLE|nr:hypothetical protein A6R68_13451 [Neotoma lepida]